MMPHVLVKGLHMGTNKLSYYDPGDGYVQSVAFEPGARKNSLYV